MTKMTSRGTSFYGVISRNGTKVKSKQGTYLESLIGIRNALLTKQTPSTNTKPPVGIQESLVGIQEPSTTTSTRGPYSEERSFIHSIYMSKLQASRKNGDAWLAKQNFMKMQLDGIIPTVEMCELVIQTFVFHLATLSSHIAGSSSEGIVVKDPMAYKLGMEALEIYSLMIAKRIPITALFVRCLYFLLEPTADLELLFWMVPNPDSDLAMAYESTSLADRLKMSSKNMDDNNIAFEGKNDPVNDEFSMDGQAAISTRNACDTDKGRHSTTFTGHFHNSGMEVQTAGGGKYDIRFSELSEEMRRQPSPASHLSSEDRIWLITEVFKKHTRRLNFFFMVSHLLYGLQLIEQEGTSLSGISHSFSKGLPTQLLASKELSLLISHWMQWLRGKIFPSLTKFRRITMIAFLFGTIGILQGSIFPHCVPTFPEFIKHCDKFVVDRYLSITAFRGPSKFTISASGAIDLSSFIMPLARDIGYSIYGTHMVVAGPTDSHHPLHEPSFHSLVMSCLLRLQCNKAAIEYFQLFCLPHIHVCYDPSINALLLKALLETGQDARALKSFQYLQAHESKLAHALERDLNARVTAKDEYRPISALLPSLSVIIPTLIASGKMRMVVFLFQRYVLSHKPLVGFEGECPFSLPYSESRGSFSVKIHPSPLKDAASAMPVGLYPYEMYIVYSMLHLRIGKPLQDASKQSSLLPSDIRLLHLLLLWLEQWALATQIQEILLQHHLLDTLIDTLERMAKSPNAPRHLLSFRMDPCAACIENDLDPILTMLKTIRGTRFLHSPVSAFSYKWCDFRFNPFSIVIQRSTKQDSMGA